MDQELKQRLIGAAVITALAAIFVPMLFDDPVDEKGKSINALTIPEVPAKVQEVEIAPLPEKVEDVANQAPVEKPLKSTPAQIDEGEGEQVAESVKPRPKLLLTGKETSFSSTRLKNVEPDADAVVDEDVPEPDVNAARSAKLSTQPQPSQVVGTTPPKILKPAAKPVEGVQTDTAIKPAESALNETGTRWYLNAGSFTQKANAQALQDNLKQQGFSATVKEVSNEKGTVYKVRVGPMLDKVKAQAVKNKLTQININSFVSPDE